MVEGTLRAGDQIALCHVNDEESPLRRRLTQLMGFSGLCREETADRSAGDLFVVAGFPEVEVGDTLADPAGSKPLPRLEVNEPVLRMTFRVNTSPLAGRDGTGLTSRQIRDRLQPEVHGNVSIHIGATSSPQVIEVAGRGEVQLAGLMESMRREGFELQVSGPEVIIHEMDPIPHEPVERAVIDVADVYVGTITQAIAPTRHGTVREIRRRGTPRFNAPCVSWKRFAVGRDGPPRQPLKELEAETARLSKLLAEAELDKAMARAADAAFTRCPTPF